MEFIKRECLIYSDRGSNSNKFYIIDIHRDNELFKVFTRYGRLGKKATVTNKVFSYIHSADAFFYKKIDEKIKKGYEYVDFEDISLNQGEFFN